jgi:hypothetical protein
LFVHNNKSSVSIYHKFFSFILFSLSHSTCITFYCYLFLSSNKAARTRTHTHTHSHTYTCIYIYVSFILVKPLVLKKSEFNKQFSQYRRHIPICALKQYTPTNKTLAFVVQITFCKCKYPFIFQADKYLLQTTVCCQH